MGTSQTQEVTEERSLERKARKALSWSFIQEGTLRGTQFLILIFLARLLSPKEFGLVAMVSVFIALAQALIDGGFASALIQAKALNERQRCSVFYFNLFTSIVLTSSLWLLAPRIAQFYGQPQLVGIIHFLSLLPVINGLGIVQNSILARNLDVKRQTLILGGSIGLAGSASLFLAWKGFGVWSLVCQQLLQASTRTVLLWVFGSWFPKDRFSLNAFKQMFSFGWGMLCSSLVFCAYDNFYPLLIGKCFSPSTVGYFNRAQSLQIVASQTLAAIANRVTFPLFSAIQEDITRVHQGLRKAITTIGFFQFPVMIGLAVVAKPFVLFAFGEKWAPCVPYLQILALSGVFYPLHVLNLGVLMALGRSDLFFRLELIKAALFIAAAFLTFRWGAIVMIWGQLVCNAVAYVIDSHFTKALVGYSLLAQIRDLCPSMIASVGMGVLTFGIGEMMPNHSLLRLFVSIPCGVLLYITLSHLIGSRVLGEVRVLFGTKLLGSTSRAE